MFNPGDIVVIGSSNELRAFQRGLCEDMERKGLKQIKGKVSEVSGGTVWINFSESIGGQRNGTYGIPEKLVKILPAPVPSAAPSESCSL